MRSYFALRKTLLVDGRFISRYHQIHRWRFISERIERFHLFLTKRRYWNTPSRLLGAVMLDIL